MSAARTAELERERRNTDELKAAGARLGGRIAELETERERLLEIIADMYSAGFAEAPRWLVDAARERARVALRAARDGGGS